MEDRLEERLQRVLEAVRGEARAAFLGDRVKDRDVELVGMLGELQEEVMREVESALGVGQRAVELVDDQDRPEADFERLAEDETRLRHWALGGVDQEEAAVGHVDDALDLAAEVGVAGGVDDVDDGVVVADRRVLGEDRDPLLALKRVGIHDQRAHLLVLPEGVALLQQRVDQRCLAVVDMGDDRQVADVVPEGCCHGFLFLPGRKRKPRAARTARGPELPT